MKKLLIVIFSLLFLTGLLFTSCKKISPTLQISENEQVSSPLEFFKLDNEYFVSFGYKGMVSLRQIRIDLVRKDLYVIDYTGCYSFFINSNEYVQILNFLRENSILKSN